MYLLSLYVVVCMLTLQHNQYAFVPCNSDCLQKYNNATGIRHDPKPLMSDSSPQNYTVPLHKESDQLNSQDSAANLTAQDSTIRSGIATPVTRDEHNSGSSHDTVCSVALPSFMPDGARYSAEKLNLTSSLQSPDSSPTLACKTLYAPCLTVVLVVVILILSCILCVILISEDLTLMP
jgi:hypothetical protein